MRNSRARFAVPVLFLSAFAGFGFAGQQVDINSFQAGMRYCPAPWGDNREFLDTHYGVDAKTGEMKKYSGSVHPDEVGDSTQSKEVLLYVAPSINAESRYVPPEQAFGRSQAPAPASRAPQQTYQAPRQPSYPQNQQAYRQPQAPRVQAQPAYPQQQYHVNAQQNRQYAVQAPQAWYPQQQQQIAPQQSQAVRSAPVMAPQQPSNQSASRDARQPKQQKSGKRPWWKAVFRN